MGESDGERSTGWGDRVVFTNDGSGAAYRPGELIVAGDRGRDVAARRFSADDLEPVFDEESLRDLPQFFRLRGDMDPMAAALDLRDEGIFAQPNHVLFAHCGCSCSCPPHPAVRWSAGIVGSPMYASPMYASPMYASPMYASPMYASGPHKSSARPCAAPATPFPSVTTGAGPRIAILDTGFASDYFRPAALGALTVDKAHWEEPDEDTDASLDPAAGHGTFIAGIIERLVPGCSITIERVLTTQGDGDEVAIARRIDALGGSVDLFNLSFGGYAVEQMRVLGAAIRRAQAAGSVIVASAGNDGTCRPSYPSALPGVIGVGAIGPHGPAPFSNFGPWVRACAPGVDVVSTFFNAFDGPAQATKGGIDPDRFRDWAMWSGTSFAAPVVVAALAAQIRSGATAAEAVVRVVDAPGLLRIPDLGTVVNLQ